MAFSFMVGGAAPTGNSVLPRFLQLSAGCVDRPLAFSNFGRALVLNETGSFLKETVPRRHGRTADIWPANGCNAY
jgi:hypothetical protein